MEAAFFVLQFSPSMPIDVRDGMPRIGRGEW
jgi:hypothetical protein